MQRKIPLRRDMKRCKGMVIPVYVSNLVKNAVLVSMNIIGKSFTIIFSTFVRNTVVATLFSLLVCFTVVLVDLSEDLKPFDHL